MRAGRALVLGLALVLLWGNPALAVVPNGVYSWWDMPSGPHYNLDSTIFVGNHVDQSKNPAWFMAHQFAPANGSPGGYIGLQVDNNTGWTNVPNNGKRVLFSWWGAVGASCSNVPGAVCRPFVEDGTGYQTAIPYDWQAGREYRARLWVLNSNPDGTTWWGGWIKDMTTGVEQAVGYMKVPSTFGWLDSGVNWIEWYGGHRNACSDIPVIIAYFHKLGGNNWTTWAKYPPDNVLRTDQRCPSDVLNWGDPWVRHLSPRL